jgi:hypothetical protein
VQENPSKQIFLTETGIKKGIFLYTKVDGAKGAFNLYNHKYHGRLSGTAGGENVANPEL